ncbi:protein MCM10-like [Pontoporia blainvillei]|uniref:Protein MCM10-like n=1 Tax=Pontoporia blainvillei TaxID=48723 RepID=A0ABX0S6J9_PONBL|nr:protein MCM10-like [Pontoporia blainvillei]
MVSENDCEYCQYHIQAQYKRLSARRADLQSTFSGGRIPKKFARKGISLKERLCQDGFYYGGVSSASYAASIAAAVAPKKKIQTTLTNLVVKGADLILQETQQKLGVPQKSLSCSEEFRELMDLPTSGARNLKHHLAKVKSSGIMGSPKPAFQSISASALLKQQKQRMLEMRKKKSEEIQKRFLQSASEVESPAVPSSSRQPPSWSPPTGAEFPKLKGAPAIQMPKLGRDISEGDDVLFFDESPPPKPKLSVLAEAKKLAAITKLRVKGQILTKTDPNSIKKLKEPQDVLEVKERVEKNNTFSPQAEDELEPARKKRREQLAYLESEDFQKILKAKSRHTGILKEGLFLLTVWGCGSLIRVLIQLACLFSSDLIIIKQLPESISDLVQGLLDVLSFQAEAELQEHYFEPLVKKEQIEEKMRNTREVKCRVVTCRTVLTY